MDTKFTLKITLVLALTGILFLGDSLYGDKERTVAPRELSEVTIETKSSNPEVQRVANDVKRFIEISKTFPKGRIQSKICSTKGDCKAFDRIVVKSMNYKSLGNIDTKISNGELTIYVNPLVQFVKDHNGIDLSLNIYHEIGHLVTYNQK